MNRLSAFDMSEVARWAACGLVVLAAHGSAGAIIANWPDPIDAAELAGAITVVLAPEATTTSDSQEDMTPGPQSTRSETPPEVKPDEKPDQRPVEAPTPEPQVVTEEKVEPRPDQPQIEAAPIVPRPEVVAALPPPKPERHAKPKPARPASIDSAPPRAPKVAAVAAAPAEGRLSGSSNVIPTWLGLIQAAIRRNLQYPSDARSRGEVGAPFVSFQLDRNGRLLSSRLVRGTGYASLDQEALAVLKRAQPFPPPPAEKGSAPHTVSVPIAFYLR